MQGVSVKNIILPASLLALILLAGCAKPIDVAAPFTLGQYRVEEVQVVVSDPAHTNDAAFRERLKASIANDLSKRAPTDDVEFPKINVVAVISRLNHSTANSYSIDSQVHLIDPKTKARISTFTAQSSAAKQQVNPPPSKGFLGGLASVMLAATLDTQINGVENNVLTSQLIGNYSIYIAHRIYP